MSSQQQQPSQQPDAAMDLLAEAYGPSIWESAVHNSKVPDDAWEYHIRRSLNDAAYNSLDYAPYCSTMPVQSKCDNPKWMWKRKERS